MTKIIERLLTAEEKAERAAWTASEYERAKSLVNEQRRQAYQLESDPIFFQSQRGDTYTLEDWKAKVAEIDARFPYPTEPS